MAEVDCLHGVIFRGLCCICGADLQRLNIPHRREVLSAASVSMVHSVPELRITQEYAMRLGKDDQDRLLRERKLVLLVDLDQTLIHTTHDPGKDESSDIYQYRLREDDNTRPLYRTKLRPYQREFFEKAASMFEFHVCTFGARMYAHKIAKILDPKGIYFSHRILSRDECFDPQSKTGNLKELFPCGTSMVCIIDDREDVWSYAPNLVQVKPYNYFEYTTDDGKKVPQVEKDNDDYLKYLPDILTRIHKSFYDELDKKKQYLVEGEDFKLPDLKEIVPSVKKSVLSRVNIVFSGVIPLNFTHQPEHHKSWIMARKLGANISKEIIEEGYERTTHIVARQSGTAKVNQAMRINAKKVKGDKRQHIHIVTPDWLESCSERWRRADENNYPLSNHRLTPSPTPPASSEPNHVVDGPSEPGTESVVDDTEMAEDSNVSPLTVDSTEPPVENIADDPVMIDVKSNDKLDESDHKEKTDAKTTTTSTSETLQDSG